jgi:hypothetical protein
MKYMLDVGASEKIIGQIGCILGKEIIKAETPRRGWSSAL